MKETFSGERKEIGVKRFPKRGKLWAPGRMHTGKEKRHNGGVGDGRGGGEREKEGEGGGGRIGKRRGG